MTPLTMPGSVTDVPTTPAQRFGVRVGDDGRWHAKYASLAEARQHAARLSTEGFLGVAQIMDFTNGWRESWCNGAPR